MQCVREGNNRVSPCVQGPCHADGSTHGPKLQPISTWADHSKVHCGLEAAPACRFNQQRQPDEPQWRHEATAATATTKSWEAPTCSDKQQRMKTAARICSQRVVIDEDSDLDGDGGGQIHDSLKMRSWWRPRICRRLAAVDEYDGEDDQRWGWQDFERLRWWAATRAPWRWRAGNGSHPGSWVRSSCERAQQKKWPSPNLSSVYSNNNQAL
jgi:hypothetical protein